MGKVVWTRGDCRMGGDWTGRDCIVMLFLTQVCALVVEYIYILRSYQYPIIFHSTGFKKNYNSKIIFQVDFFLRTEPLC